MLKHAFKEWAVICRALADGRQGLILRKGGIAETADEFEMEQDRFWLFPTFTHQQREGIKPEANSLLEEVEAGKPPAGVVRLSHFAEVGGIYHVHALPPLLFLDRLHLCSEETVRKRFAYRAPGLYVLPVRVYEAREVFEIPNTAGYDGCRTWVELEKELPTDGARPVWSDEQFHDLLLTLDRLLNPIVLA